MGVVHRPHPDWGSHIPVLVKALELTDGPVLELGMGIMSTPILHALCEDQNRYLKSYESEEYYTKLLRNFRTSSHHITLVDDWSKHDITYKPWSVVLVDQKPAEARKESIKQLTDVDYVIVHDTQLHAETPLYAYEEVFPIFKYLYDYKKFNTWTTVLSNKHELHQFHNTLG